MVLMDLEPNPRAIKGKVQRAMNNAKRIAIGFTILFVASIFAMLMPTGVAQAQDQPLRVNEVVKPNVKIEENKALLFPETRQAEIDYKFGVKIPPLSGCTVDITVTFKYLPGEESAYSTAVLSPQQLIKTFDTGDSAAPVPFVNPSGSEVTGFDTTLTVSFFRNAPAFQDAKFKVQATALASASTSDSCNVGDSQPTDSEASLKPDYLASMSIQPSSIIQTSGQNKRVLFPVKIVNFGNGPTRVITTIVEKTQGLNAVQPPAEVLLESKATQGDQALNQQDIFITVLTPNNNGYTNKVYSFDATFKAKADTSETGSFAEQEITVPFSLKVQGVYVPGFDSVSLIAALGVGLLGLSRMRRRLE